MMTDPTNPTERLDGIKPIGEDRGAPGQLPTSSFQSYMEAPAKNPLAQAQGSTLSPFDLGHGKTTMTASPTLDTLVSQTKMAHTSLGDISAQLSTPNLKLKQSQKLLLRNKLTEANTHLRSASATMGAEVPKEKIVPPGAGPVQKFLGYVSDGQTMMDSAIQQLASLKDKQGTLTPGDFLLIQLKLNKAQQEIEYSSVLLSKVIDDMKTLMNIQL